MENKKTTDEEKTTLELEESEKANTIQYNALYAQAVELQERFERLISLYNVLLEKYLSGK